MSVSEDKLTAAENAAPVTDENPEAAGNEAGSLEAEAADAAFADPEAMIDALETARREAAEMKEQFLRASAEMENIRRRSEQEVSKARKFAVEGFAGEMLSVKDSLDLAANVDMSGEAHSVVTGMQEGLELTLRQLNGVFDKFGIATVEPEAGEKLNPDFHQAMSLQEHGEIPPNHIVQVIQKGYTLNERLLRPAMVIVAKAPAA